ncbi:MAG TPA: ATP-binding protein [Cytophagales bacterium]|nr:ATP-binding protein [Cytophagales bacterium]
MLQYYFQIKNNFIDNFFPTVPDEYRQEFDRRITLLNIQRIRIFAIILLLYYLFLGLVPDLYFYLNGLWEYKAGYQYWAIIHVLAVVFMAGIIFVITKKWPKNQEDINDFHRNTQIAFLAASLFICTSVTIVDQFMTGSISTYILGFTWVSAGLFFYNRTILPLYLITHTLFIFSLSYFQIDPLIRYTHHINGFALVLMMWLVSRFLFSMHLKNYLNIKTIEKQATDLEQVNQKLTESEMLLSSINKNVLQGLFRVTEDYTIMYANSYFAKLFDYNTPEEVINNKENPFLKINEEKRNELMKHLKVNKFYKDEEVLFTRKDGTEFWGLMSCNSVIDEHNRILFYDGSVLDITQRKEAEQELKIAKEQAEQSMSMKEQFVSTMSHEIRTPLNAVIGMTNLLVAEEPKKEQLEYLNILKISSDNLLNIVNHILDFSKIDSGKITFEEIPFNVETLIKNLKKIYSYKANKKQLSLNVDVELDSDATVLGDPTTLNQIMVNLLDNAIKFTEEGGVNISVKNKGETDTTVTLYFEVSDTGIGIPLEKQHFIFESFTQASSETTRKYGGTGLGLAITKKLIELQGGKLEIDSSFEKGARFFFSLKLKKPEKGTQELKPAPSETIESLDGVKILLVEDNMMNQKVVFHICQRFKVDLEMSDNGFDAIEKVKHKEYDVILMDIEMPEIDGYQTTRRIKAEDNLNSKTPIIALTASSTANVKEKALKSGMVDMISKPFNPVDFYKIISINARNKVAGEKI